MLDVLFWLEAAMDPTRAGPQAADKGCVAAWHTDLAQSTECKLRAIASEEQEIRHLAHHDQRISPNNSRSLPSNAFELVPGDSG